MKKILLLLFVATAFAQVETPNNKYLFESDSSDYKKAEKDRVRQVYQNEKPANDKFDFQAGKLNFDKEKSELVGTGGVVASGDGIQIQADKGRINSQTKDSRFSGNVLLNYGAGKVFSKKTDFNLDSELGTFTDAELEFDEGEYYIEAEQMKKTGEDTFDFGKSIFSTCHCPDGDLPWKLTCGNSKAQIPGSAVATNVVLDFHGVPIFYSPYLFYPVNIDRQSGMLAPSFGYGNQDGFEVNLPYFITAGESADVLLTPFWQSRSRVGTGIELRKEFSYKSSLRGKLLFSDEAERNGDLRGTNVSGLFDQKPDEQRVGAYMQQYWSTSATNTIPAYMTSDIHYVSDDLFLREFDEEYKIGQRADVSTTSRVTFGVSPASFWNTNLDLVYNQNINAQSDDFVFQRLPQWKNNFFQNFKPFKNSYGLKLKTSLSNTNTMFSRKEGYEGTRSIFVPKVEVPFFYKSYLDGGFAVSFNQAYYSLSDETIPVDPTNPTQRQDISDDARGVSKFEYKMGTALEKVYETNGFFRALTGNTIFSQNEDVTAVKHVVEPFARYVYSPTTDQTRIPIFDANDVLNLNNLVVYGLSNTWVGKVDRGESEFSDFVDDEILFSNSLANLAKGYGTLPTFSGSTGTGSGAGFASGTSTLKNKKFTTRDIMGFDIKQGYFVDPADDVNDFTNIDTTWTLSPERGFGLKFDSSFNPDSSELEGWRVGTHLKTLRGDIIRLANTFQKQNDITTYSQIEGSLEVPVVQQLLLAGYGRYDEKDSGFLERKIAMRFSGSCNCWHMDLGYRELLNPSKEEFIWGLTFNGLGDLSQSVSTIKNVQQQQGN